MVSTSNMKSLNAIVMATVASVCLGSPLRYYLAYDALDSSTPLTATIGRQIFIELVGEDANEQAVWHVPPMCSVEQASASVFTGSRLSITCFETGNVELVGKMADGSRHTTIPLNIMASAGCYDWEIAFLQNHVQTSVIEPLVPVEILIWITQGPFTKFSNSTNVFSMTSATNCTVKENSATSQCSELTLKFVELGEFPSLNFEDESLLASTASLVNNTVPLTFDATVAMWRWTFAANAEGILNFVIEGTGSSVLSCQVKNRPYTLPAVYTEAQVTRAATTAQGISPKSLAIKRNFCGTQDAVGLVSHSDGDKQNILFRLFPDFAQTSIIDLTAMLQVTSLFDFAPTQGYVLLSGVDGSLWRYDNAMLQGLVRLDSHANSNIVYGNSAGNAVIGRVNVIQDSCYGGCNIEVPHACSNVAKSELTNHVVAWPNNGTKLLDSIDGGFTWRLLPLLHDSVQIYSVAVLSGRQFLGILASKGGAGTTEMFLTLKDRVELVDGPAADATYVDYVVTVVHTWIVPFLAKGLSNGGFLPEQKRPKLLTSATLTNELFAYGDSLLYSPNSGLTFRDDVSLIAAGGVNYILPSNSDYIQDIDMSNKGKLVVLTHRGRVFGGHVSLPALYELNHRIVSAETSALAFTNTGTLMGVVAKSTAPYIASHQIITDIQGTCPHADEWVTDLQPVYYLDLHITLQATVTVRSPIGSSYLSPGGLSIVASPPDILLVNQNSPTSLLKNNQGTVTEITRTFKFGESDLVSNLPRRWKNLMTIGQQDIRITPWASHPSCKVPQLVSQVKVGCSPTRHLRVKYETLGMDMCPGIPLSSTNAADFASCYCDKFAQNFKFTVRKETYYDSLSAKVQPVKDLKDLYFDYPRFGCPIRRIHELDYLPTLELWDGDTYIADVLSDYNIVELNNRRDATYTKTADQVGCMQKPPVWADMMAKYGKGFDSWTPENHYSCWSTGSPAVSQTVLQSIPYQILNKTGINSLKFTTKSVDGIFLFQARVVDPDFSYCDLTAEFAVDLFGSPLLIGDVATIFAISTAIFIVVMGSVFWLYVRSI